MRQDSISHSANDDAIVTPQPPAEPLEELVLELTDLKLEKIQDGVRRATARARLVYEPATPGQRPVASAQSWRFVAPLGPLEADDLRWYLEKYAIWPGDVFRPRARKVEETLVIWGRQLHDAAMPAEAANVLQAWADIDGHAGRRFSIHVDRACEVGASAAEVATAREAATLLLGLPWELLHDGDNFLFQGTWPTRVCRRVPSTPKLDTVVVATPIRILLICARPEDEACGYIDHRASAIPLVDAMEQLPGLVQLHILAPPTLPTLRDELNRARRAGQPYHAIHFDGHGVYDHRSGRGCLCFEHPDDAAKLESRRHQTIFADELGKLLRDHRIPLVFLEACQTAKAEHASESVASELLHGGVGSVVAMSHSVLVETARRFVAAFYAALARECRVGDAMLEGQRHLKDDTLRGRIFGVGELRLEDWFVPVLFQAKNDPQLFRDTRAKQMQGDSQAALRNRLGEMPPLPETGFVGRGRELLALERLLSRERYAVLRGGGGEGKTALAVAFARWMVRSQRFHRAAFVSVEAYGTARAVLDVLGRQLVGASYSVATFANIDQAEEPVAHTLVEQPSLVVVDNLESILPPPYLAVDTPELFAEDHRDELAAILGLCERLQSHGETRLVFTSREALPAPFDGEANRRELQRLHRDDAVKLVERSVHQHAVKAWVSDAQRAAIEDLVDAVYGHARTLTLLAPVFQRFGVDATRKKLVELMADIDRRFPGVREKSLFASVELSLRRLSPEARERVNVLGVFHGGVDLDMLGAMMDSEADDVASLADELVATGLATHDRDNHLTLDPALCPYLRSALEDADREALMHRWVDQMRRYVDLLYQQYGQNSELAAALTLSELPNLFALLAHVSRAGDAAATIDLATNLHLVLNTLGRRRLVVRIAEVRDAAASLIGAAWTRTRFQTARSRIDEQLESGRPLEALVGARELFKQARAAGEAAYSGADYDLARACWLLGRALETTGRAEEALPLLDEAQQRCETILIREAAHLSAGCLGDKGRCLRALGRLDESAAALKESYRRFEELGDERALGVGLADLASVYRLQGRYRDSLDAYSKSRESGVRLNDPGFVALALHNMGIVHRELEEVEKSEDAFRKALAIEVQLGNVWHQAATLTELGNLSSDLNRHEDAASLYQNAADLYVAIGDLRGESGCRNNLAQVLTRLGRGDEARRAIRRAIECGELFGHTVEPWKNWAILADIEAKAGNSSAAAHARAKAISDYLAFRRDGGENHDADGELGIDVLQRLRVGDASEAISFLQELLDHPMILSWLRPFAAALRAIAAGSRDRSLADAPDLRYTSAAELLLVLDALGA